MNYRIKFIDPRIDFAFKKIFGSEDAKDILISFLESLLQLEGDRRIQTLTLLDPFLAPRIREMKYSILDVKCTDHRGISYIVEMQVQKVEAFLKQIQYKTAKVYVNQLPAGEDYTILNKVIGITITDFVLFKNFNHYISHHENRETITGHSYLSDILHCFIELPKFTKSLEELDAVIDKWIYFVKYAGSLDRIPDIMHTEPFFRAFERARVANMNAEELEMYENACMAIVNARGAVVNARQEGKKEGKTEILTRILQHRFGTIPEWVHEKMIQAEPSALDEWTLRILGATTLDGVFEDRI
ncbi:MAG: Rpn family recombination-promoting nuclease/putative transposase [Magnetococcus sp. YQC-5]